MGETRFEQGDLPAVFDLVVCASGLDAAEEACRHAALGAEEGTLVCVAEDDASDRQDAADLSCAIVLRPDCARELALQLVPVAVVSLGAYVAAEAPPLTVLRYGSNGELLIGESRLAEVTAVPGPAQGDGYDWLVLGLTMNVCRTSRAPGETSLRAVGVEEVDPSQALTGFARYFLSWIGRWADEGFEPVRKAWLLRARDVDEARGHGA